MEILILIVSTMGFFVCMYMGQKNGYKQGQIDALNGKIKYELKKNEAGESVWTIKKN